MATFTRFALRLPIFLLAAGTLSLPLVAAAEDRIEPAGGLENAPAPEGDAPPAPPPEQVAEGDPAAIQLTIVPSNASLNLSLNFDEEGNVRHRNEQLTLNFNCFYTATTPPLAYSDLKITRILTSANEELTPDPDQVGRRGVQELRPDQQMNGKPYFSLYFNIPVPKRPAETIRELRGSFTMEVPGEPMRVLRLAPASKYLGKRFRVVDLGDTIWSLRTSDRRNNGPQVEFIHDRSFQQLIQEVEFYSNQGLKIETTRNGWTSNNNDTIRYFGVDLPEDAVVVVKLFRKSRSVEVPFVINDVPLPTLQPQGPVFDLAIATIPLEEALKPGPGEAARPDNPAGQPDAAAPPQLEVIILN